MDLKSMIGHTLGAAGAVESIVAVVQLEEGFLI
jgi:3-oxoacyl-(acyl-carrier-protein) synthase